MEKIKYLIGIVINLFLFIPFLGYVHLFDWDEINFAECAREMVRSGHYHTVTIDYIPFWEKPPVFIWMQALAMKTFGVNEFAARFPNVIAGVFTLISLVYHGKNAQNEKLGWWWAAFYLGSFLPNLYFHSGIIDPWFNLFIFNSLAFYIFGIKDKKTFAFVCAGLFAGLAVLTKGPVALILIGAPLFIFHLVNRFQGLPKIKHLLFAFTTAVFIGLLWFMMLYATGNKEVIQQFIEYQVRLFNTRDAGHGGPIYYHLLVLLLGCFPASFFAIGGLLRKNPKPQDLRRIMLISGLFTLVLFSIVQTKIIHYSSLCYFPITFFAADFITHYKNRQNGIYFKLSIFYQLILALAMGVFVYIQTFGGGIQKWIAIQDPFAAANLLAQERWSLLDFIPVLVWILGAVLAFVFFRRNQVKYAINTLLVSVALNMIVIKATILPHIEAYSQRAAISFYQKKSKENVYIIPLGFKSYAHFFYGEVKPHLNQNRFNEKWICGTDTDLKTFYVVRLPDKKFYLDTYPNLKLIYEKNGFVFLGQKKNLSLKPKIRTTP
jgi:4-amino-4-deoxy-L-arabinose transferase-like glycosyltransferase